MSKKKQEYNFGKAYKAYKEGKEIESLAERCKYKIINNDNKYCNNICDEWRKCYGFTFNEINSKWYIND